MKKQSQRQKKKRPKKKISVTKKTEGVDSNVKPLPKEMVQQKPVRTNSKKMSEKKVLIIYKILSYKSGKIMAKIFFNCSFGLNQKFKNSKRSGGIKRSAYSNLSKKLSLNFQDTQNQKKIKLYYGVVLYFIS